MKYLTTILLFFFVFTPFVSANITTDLSTGLKACWDLEEASGTRLDETTNCGGGGCDLTAIGSPDNFTGIESGTFGVDLDINLSYLYHADNADLDIDDGWSISFWFYPDSSKFAARTYFYQIWKRTGENGVGVWIQKNGDDWNVYTASGSGLFSGGYTTEVVNLDEWNHFVVYYNGANSETYLNGVNESVSRNAITTNNDDLTIGRDVANTSFAGAMDAVAIWNNEIDSTEVATLYNDGLGIHCALDDPVAGGDAGWEDTIIISLKKTWNKIISLFV